VFHNTRHTAMTNLVNAGLPTHEAMAVREPELEPTFAANLGCRTCPNFAWLVNFSAGDVGFSAKSNGLYARAVRSGL